MRQRLHPEATWAKPYAWCDIPTSNLCPLGSPKTVAQVDQDLRLSWDNGIICTIAVIIPGIIHLEWSHPSVTTLPLSGGVVLQNTQRDAAATLVVGSGTARLQTLDWILELHEDGSLTWGQIGCQVAIDWRSICLTPSEQGFRFLADFSLADGEAIHGCGGRTGPLNRRGSTCDFFSMKVDGPENGDYGGLPMPFVTTSRGAGLFFDNPWPHVYADFGYTDPDCMRWFAPAGPARWYLLAGSSPQEVQQRWHVLTGAPALPPQWFFGLWISLCGGGGSGDKGRPTAQDWSAWLDQFRQGNWPLDVMVFDLEWRGGEMIMQGEGGDGTGLEWHASFGDGPGLMRQAEMADVKICLHLNTRQYGPNISHKGIAEGWLRRVDEQVVVDPSTPTKADAAWALHAPRVAEGVALWWTDNGERVDGTLGDGLPSRNLFGSRWNTFLFEKMRENGLENRLVLSRGDWVGAQRHCSPWPGDTCPGVDRLDEDLRFILNCAVSGVPFSGTDLGAFRHCKEDGEQMDDRMIARENLVRRVIHGFLYQPIARIHNSKLHKFPWTLSPALQRLFRIYIELRYRLMPWWWSAAIRASEDSIPLVRPLWFDFPEDATLRSIDDEMLVGDGLLVAPVVKDAAWDRRVRLPHGLWYHYWSNTPYAGGREYIVDASADAIDGLPIFVRAGSVLVYGPKVDRCPKIPAQELWLDAYPGRNASGNLRRNPKESPALSWIIAGSELHLTCGNDPLLIHVVGQNLDLKQGQVICVKLAGNLRNPSPLTIELPAPLRLSAPDHSRGGKQVPGLWRPGARVRPRPV